VRLVFLTQVLDRRDAILGFVPGWVEGLARRCERVRVVALATGDVAGLPDNVDVRAVGRRGRLGRWLRYRAALGEAFGRDGFDAVLAHMVPRYALLARGPARAAGARTYLWYTHAGVDRRLERAVAAVEKVFTASPESLRVDTPRRVVTGHGIDLDHFDDRGAVPARPTRLITVGRLTPAKDPLTVLRCLAVLVGRGWDVHLELIGGGMTELDKSYARAIEAEIAHLDLGRRVTRTGPVPYPEVPEHYHRASVLVSASRTGSVDKVVLEAMAARRPVVTCNEAFPRVLAPLGDAARALAFEPGDAEGLADKVEGLLRLPAPERAALGERLRAIVARDHELERLLDRLVAEMQPAGGRP
jgi:glycosyltransferase involved in cell wall biosynthesis